MRPAVLVRSPGRRDQRLWLIRPRFPTTAGRRFPPGAAPSASAGERSGHSRYPALRSRSPPVRHRSGPDPVVCPRCLVSAHDRVRPAGPSPMAHANRADRVLRARLRPQGRCRSSISLSRSAMARCRSRAPGAFVKWLPVTLRCRSHSAWVRGFMSPLASKRYRRLNVVTATRRLDFAHRDARLPRRVLTCRSSLGYARAYFTSLSSVPTVSCATPIVRLPSWRAAGAIEEDPSCVSHPIGPAGLNPIPGPSASPIEIGRLTLGGGRQPLKRRLQC